MQGLMAVLLLLLVICAVAVSATRKLLPAVIIFMSYSMIMSIVWLLLRAPDLAITEAAVGAGITSVLFFITMRRLGLLKKNLQKLKRKKKLLHQNHTDSHLLQILFSI